MQISDLSFLHDMSADTIGFSCGDRLELDVSIEPDGQLRCRVGGDYCSVSRRSFDLMVEWLAGKAIDEIITAIGQQCPPVSANSACALMAAAHRDHRTACVEAPWHALQGALSQWQQGRPDAKCTSALACDACVFARAITWGGADSEAEATCVPSHSSDESTIASDVWKIVTKLTTENLSDTERQVAHNQRFAKLDLTSAEAVEMDRFLRYVDTDGGVLEGQHSSIPNFLDNIRKHQLAVIPRGLRRYFRRRQLASMLAVKEAEAIRKALLAAKIPFAFVKGVATRRFYGQTRSRLFSDLDIVTPDAESALAAAQRLIVEHGYRLTGEGSIPFSLKINANADGKEVLSGHMHISRAVGKDRLIVDIGFPSLPLGRLEVLDFPATSAAGDAAPEELIVVALAHLLKHEIAYAKDLNDIRLVMAGPEVTPDRLWSLVERYKLEFALTLACAFVLKSYQLSAEERVRVVALTERTRPLHRRVSAFLLMKGWPFRAITHQWAQAFDLFQRRAARVGVKMALRQLKSTLCDEAVPVTDHRSSDGTAEALRLRAFERLYLTPLVLNLRGRSNGGNLYGQALTTPNLRVIEDGPARLVLTPFGIFLPTASWRSGESRAAVESSARTAITRIGWDAQDLSVVRNGIG